MKDLIQKLLKGETNQTLIQLFRYFFVGGLAFVCDFASLFALTEYAGWHYLYSAAAGFGIGTVVNYMLSIRWVFFDHKMRDLRLEFLIFAGLGGIGLLFNHGFMWLFTELVGIQYLISKLITTALVFFCNFFSRKLILYQTEKKP